MKAWIISNTVNFIYKHEEPLLHFNNDYLLINLDEQIVTNIIDDKLAWDYFGKVFKSSIVNTPFFYRLENVNSIDEVSELSKDSLENLEYLFLFMWFVKDHNCDIGLIGACSEGGYYQLVSNTKSSYSSQGLKVDVEFNFGELMQAANLLNLFNKFTNNDITSNENIDTKKSSSRLQRSVSFLRSARFTQDLRKKISFYVLVLECLFSANDSTEIVHKLSERIALFMGKDSDEKKGIYENVKTYYNIRSKYIHGQESDKKYKSDESLKTVSQSIDSLIRRILVKILTTDSDPFLQADSNLKIWFNELLFR